MLNVKLYNTVSCNMTRMKAKWKYASLLIVCVYIFGLLYFNAGVLQLNKEVWPIKGNFFGDSEVPARSGLLETLEDKIDTLTVREYNNSTFEFRDLDSYQKVPWNYDKRFKNPCWYENRRLKCLPYFFIVGMKKCGTTTLYDRILEHPDVVDPGFKESFFFDWRTFLYENDTKDIYNYIDTYGNASKQIEEFSKNESNKGTPNKQIFCDASAGIADINFKWRKMPSNEGRAEPKYVNFDYINRLVPKAKIIVLFRDPIERFYSAYYFAPKIQKDEKTGRIAGPEHFNEFVMKAIRDYIKCLQRNSLRQCIYKASLYTKTVSLSPGIYHVYWQELLRVFPREQIHVIQTKDLDSTQTLQNVFEFLELSPVGINLSNIVSREKRNTRLTQFTTRGSMWDSTRKLLHDFYKPHNEHMAALTGDKQFLYLSDVD